VGWVKGVCVGWLWARSCLYKGLTNRMKAPSGLCTKTRLVLNNTAAALDQPLTTDVRSKCWFSSELVKVCTERISSSVLNIVVCNSSLCATVRLRLLQRIWGLKDPHKLSTDQYSVLLNWINDMYHSEGGFTSHVPIHDVLDILLPEIWFCLIVSPEGHSDNLSDGNAARVE